eukprot:TRINITY_DN3108_c0_g1_i13.p1 TRINITY_DN3108_c0_g1~~TRINITY_DN3108_c0_g1_i13.p1  ORF type:complete len:756 (-),score=138.24 TRINITY_DN3108_c0_g1_i13:3451-5718(-)
MWLEEGLVIFMLLNVASILTEGRKEKILKYLWRKKVDVAILTEVNLSRDNMKDFRIKGWNWAAEVPMVNNRSGVLILTKKENRIVKEIHPESVVLQGRLLITELQMKKGRNRKIKVWAYYAPADRRDRGEYLMKMEEHMEKEYSEEDFNILAGDTNLVIHPKDKVGRIGNSESIKQGHRIKEMMGTRGVQEIFRFFKKDTPTQQEWTHETTRTTEKGKIKAQARIDHFWTNRTEHIHDIKMDMDFAMSDHRPMFLALLKEEKENNVQVNPETRRRRKYLVDANRPEEIELFKSNLEARSKLLTQETAKMMTRKDRNILSICKTDEISRIIKELSEGIFQAASTAFKNHPKFVFMNYEEAIRPGTPLMILRMAHKMMKRKVEVAINLTKGTTLESDRAIRFLNREWKEPVYKKMKEKFKFGPKYGAAWTAIKEKLRERETVTAEDIGKEQMQKWMTQMKELRNKTKNLYKRMRKEIKRDIANHNNQISQEIGAESFRKYRSMKTGGKQRTALSEVKNAEGKVICEANKVKEVIAERMQEIYQQAWPKNNARTKEKPWMRIPIWEEYKRKAKEYRTQVRDIFSPLGRKEAMEILSTAQSNSGPGLDGVTYGHLKSLTKKWATILLNIVNWTLLKREVQEELKEIIIYPIYKNKGDPREMASYRGIALQRTILKFINMVVTARKTAMKIHMDTHSDAIGAGRTGIPASFRYSQNSSGQIWNKITLHIFGLPVRNNDTEAVYHRDGTGIGKNNEEQRIQ